MRVVENERRHFAKYILNIFGDGTLHCLTERPTEIDLEKESEAAEALCSYGSFQDIGHISILNFTIIALGHIGFSIICTFWQSIK